MTQNDPSSVSLFGTCRENYKRPPHIRDGPLIISFSIRRSERLIGLIHDIFIDDVDIVFVVGSDSDIIAYPA